MRLLQIIIVLFGISFITFGLTYMSPGDPVRNMYSANGVMPTEEIDALKNAFPLYRVAQIQPLHVPQLNAERHLIQIAPQ